MTEIVLYLKAIMMGIVEGLTEFLPISSTGHLILAENVLQFTGKKADTFSIFIQLGAILAVCWYYRERLWQVVRDLPTEPRAQRFALNLIIAFIPAMVLGLALHKLIKQHLFSPYTVAIALIVGGAIILLVERLSHRPHIHSVDDMRWQDALKVGFAQTFALFPGTSRSAATIVGGLLFGLSRPVATEFSFFLSIPTIFAATVYDLLKNISLLHTQDIGIFTIGFIVAFFSALFAVKGFIRYVAHHNFDMFAYYRLILGGVVLMYFGM
jgi:undecaprenyl-diphosphatase